MSRTQADSQTRHPEPPRRPEGFGFAVYPIQNDRFAVYFDDMPLATFDTRVDADAHKQALVEGRV